MRVLIVEDNQAMRRMIRRMLRDVADEISECGDGAAAFSMYEALRPDWVLMDIEMGQLNGLEATRRIVAAYRDARIIIVTNYNDAELRATAQAVGACGYILKDDLSALKQMLVTPS